MAKRTVFLLVVLLLVTSYSVPARAVSASAPKAAREPAPQSKVQVWNDPGGDLWVSTPYYTWNITGGSAILPPSGSPAMTVSAGTRLVNSLFLAPGAAEDLTGKILFSLPDEAAVYIQRSGPAGEEGLELHFRAEDGLITLVHRGQGQASSLSQPVLPDFSFAGRPEISAQEGTLPLSSEGLLPRAFRYWTKYDPSSGQGIAMLTPETSDAAAGLPGTSAACPPGNSDQYFIGCDFAQYALPGKVLATRYLLVYRAEDEPSIKPLQTLAAQLQLSLPDLDAASIARLPRYDYDADKNTPAAGDQVTFTARIANRGGTASGEFAYLWRIDGVSAGSGIHASLAAGQTNEMSISWAWQTGAHTVSLTLDPNNILTEVSKQNNTVEDRTNALAIGLWVEQSVYDYFNTHQVDLGLGSVSWDDWAQRQVRVWNQIFVASVTPLTPNGITERVRLDKVTIVPDGALPNPYPSNFPDTSDKSIDMQWGIPSEMVGVPSTHPQYGPGYIDGPEGQNVDYGLLHELSHARYLDDLYAIDINADRTYLNAAVGSSNTSLVIVDTAGSSPFSLPAYLAIDGELVVCQNGTGHTFTNCQRGAEGTTPRSHASGAIVNRAGVRLQDGLGNLVMGSSAMPFIGFDAILYYNRYGDDMMSGGKIYREHSAYAWERILGKRPVCGNYNAPCNLGEYQNDAPQHNIFTIANGRTPIAGATVQVYSAQPDWNNGYNVEVYLNSPDATYTTDSQGQVDLGHFPFNPTSPVATSYNRVFILKVTASGESSYHFVEITLFNEAYWAGFKDTAWYYLNITTGQVDLWIKAGSLEALPGQIVTLRAVVGNYGGATANAPIVSASFDPAMEVVSAFPSPSSQSAGLVTWSFPDLLSMDVGAVLLNLRLPDQYEATGYDVQWQIQHAQEMYPQDNQATSHISVSLLHTMFVPLVLKNYKTQYTLKVITSPDDVELGMVACNSWSVCRNSSSGNYLLTGYASGTVEAVWDGSQYGVKRAFLYFDLGSLPTDAVIRSISLHIYSGPYQAGNTNIHVVHTQAGMPPTYADFGKVIFSSGGSATFTASSWISIPLNEAAFAWFTPGTLSRLALVNELDLFNTTPTAGNSSSIQLYEDGTRQPYLLITYEK